MKEEATRNPIWDRDETLLALNLYLRCGGKVPDKADDRVLKLSELLRSNSIYSRYRSRANFRSPSAVVLKLNNIRQAAEGRGMPNNSKLDEEIWKEFGSTPSSVAELATQVSAAMSPDTYERMPLPDDEFIFREGGLLTRRHQVRERDPRLRRKVLDVKEKNSSLQCEVCAISYSHLAPTLRRAEFEVHHLVPVAVAGQRRVGIRDVALLCASCHRLVHRLISQNRHWMTIEEIRSALSKAPA